MLYCATGINNPAILEDALLPPHGGVDALHPLSGEDEGRCATIARVALNLGLLATEEGVQVLPLGSRAERRRRRSRGGGRMARLGARDAREVVIREVDLIVRTSRARDHAPGQGGWRQPVHIRRGH